MGIQRLLKTMLASEATDLHVQAEATPEAIARFGPPETVVAQARDHALESAPRYFEFATRWPHLVEVIGQDTALRHRLLARLHQPA